MVLDKPLQGKYVNLRSVTEDDAEFTLNIRQDTELTKYIPRIDCSLDQQRKWIVTQRQKDNDIFLIIEDKDGDRWGTISLYDINLNQSECEIGRFISRGSPIFNVEAAFLIIDYAYNNGIKMIRMKCDVENVNVIKFWQRLGAYIRFYEQQSVWNAACMSLERDEYELHRAVYRRLLGNR